MKKALLLLAACAFTTASFAQAPATEVKVRDNGTKKIVTEHGDTKTVTKTGKTNVGKVLENSTEAAGKLAKKTGKKIKHGTQKVGKKSVKATEKMEEKAQ